MLVIAIIVSFLSFTNGAPMEKRHTRRHVTFANHYNTPPPWINPCGVDLFNVSRVVSIFSSCSSIQICQLSLSIRLCICFGCFYSNLDLFTFSVFFSRQFSRPKHWNHSVKKSNDSSQVWTHQVCNRLTQVTFHGGSLKMEPINFCIASIHHHWT